MAYATGYMSVGLESRSPVTKCWTNHTSFWCKSYHWEELLKLCVK